MVLRGRKFEERNASGRARRYHDRQPCSHGRGSTKPSRLALYPGRTPIFGKQLRTWYGIAAHKQTSLAVKCRVDTRLSGSSLSQRARLGRSERSKIATTMDANLRISHRAAPATLKEPQSCLAPL